MITRGGRAVRNSALTKKLTDEFFFFFTDMTSVPWQCIFLAASHKRQFSKMAAYKACGHDNLCTVGWIAFKFSMVVL